MIKLWAEKELRNLRRISQSSIPCPEPIFVKANVLMMKFIGKDMQAAPRLVFNSIHRQKDAIGISQEGYHDIYI